jgi:phosphoribosylanthranilate isomerase
VLDAPGELYGGSGHTFDWSRAKGAERKILLAGGLGPDNVQQAIATARPWGVDACSRLELRPGIKDHAKVARFIELALTA